MATSIPQQDEVILVNRNISKLIYVLQIMLLIIASIVVLLSLNISDLSAIDAEWVSKDSLDEGLTMIRYFGLAASLSIAISQSEGLVAFSKRRKTEISFYAVLCSIAAVNAFICGLYPALSWRVVSSICKSSVSCYPCDSPTTEECRNEAQAAQMNCYYNIHDHEQICSKLSTRLNLSTSCIFGACFLLLFSAAVAHWIAKVAKQASDVIYFPIPQFAVTQQVIYAHEFQLAPIYAV